MTALEHEVLDENRRTRRQPIEEMAALFFGTAKEIALC